MIKYAVISGTVSVVANASYASGFGAIKPMSQFTGYPQNINALVGYLHKTAYHNSKVGISIRTDSNVCVHGADAGDYVVEGVLLYR